MRYVAVALPPLTAPGSGGSRCVRGDALLWRATTGPSRLDFDNNGFEAILTSSIRLQVGSYTRSLQVNERRRSCPASLVTSSKCKMSHRRSILTTPRRAILFPLVQRHRMRGATACGHASQGSRSHPTTSWTVQQIARRRTRPPSSLARPAVTSRGETGRTRSTDTARRRGEEGARRRPPSPPALQGARRREFGQRPPASLIVPPVQQQKPVARFLLEGCCSTSFGWPMDTCRRGTGPPPETLYAGRHDVPAATHRGPSPQGPAPTCRRGFGQPSPASNEPPNVAEAFCRYPFLEAPAPTRLRGW
jgi:hypothetical protein